MTRYRSEDEFQAAIEARARRIWSERETKMFERGSRFAQSWEQGTDTARRATLAMAKADILAQK